MCEIIWWTLKNFLEKVQASDPVLIETLNETDLCRSSWLCVISKSSTWTQRVDSEMIYRENNRGGNQARERANA